MMIDPENRLWLFWPVLIADTSESALTNYLFSHDYAGDGQPKWAWQGVIYIKPDHFSAELSPADRERLAGGSKGYAGPAPGDRRPHQRQDVSAHGLACSL